MAVKIDCIIVSGAPEKDLDFLKQNIPDVAYIIAADSGYLKLSEIGVKPDLIVADFDSSTKPEFDVECEIQPVEKDSTDTFNAVKAAVKRGYKAIRILGALGGRLDHTYANLLCLDYCNKNGVYCEIADRNNRLSIIEGEKVINKDYKWFSLYAFINRCTGVRISGAHYTAGFYGREALDFELGDQIGQSNYVEGEECSVTVESGTLLLIESNDYS